jgi:hypothetical protein
MDAVLGRRQLFYGETRRMIRAENIATAYYTRKHSDNWAKWASDNPAAEKLLNEAELLCL